MDNEFPPNSNSDRESPRRERAVEKPADKKVIRQVTTSKVTVRKKPLRRKFFEAFRPEDNKGFVEHILLDVLVPGIKDAVADASTSMIESALGVDGRRSSRSSRRERGSKVSYNRMSEPGERKSRREGPIRSDTAEIIVDTRHEATEAMDQMYELLSKYEVVSMRDLLSIVGEPHNSTDDEWGWTDLRGSRIQHVNGGYLLDLPRTEPLD